MAKDDARYTGNFFNSYTNTRMKLHRHCVPLDDNPAKIAAVYGYARCEVNEIFAELERDLELAAAEVKKEFGNQIVNKMGNLKGNLVFVGDQITSEYLSYFNIIKRVLADFKEVSVSIAGNTGDTSNQSLQYIYGLAVSQRPIITSLFIGTNDAFCSRDAYKKTVSSREEYHDNIDYLTKVMIHNGSKVIINALPPVEQHAAENAYKHMNWTIENEEIKARNEILRQIAKSNHCIFNDIPESLNDLKMPVHLEGNGVLLSKEAQLHIAKCFMRIVLNEL